MIDLDDITADEATPVAATVAPEDLRCGDYVSFLNETCEFPSWLWNCDVQFNRGNEFLRVQLLSRRAGTPLKVKAICLPFVLMRDPKGKYCTVDMRSSQLVRLSYGYARRAWAAMRKKRKRNKRK